MADQLTQQEATAASALPNTPVAEDLAVLESLAPVAGLLLAIGCSTWLWPYLKPLLHKLLFDHFPFLKPGAFHAKSQDRVPHEHSQVR